MAAFTKKSVLHLIGSTKDDYYYAVSVLYARQLSESTWHQGKYDFYYAIVCPDFEWKFPNSLERESIERAPKVGMSEALQHIAQSINPDVMIPHMFCPEGMTKYRALFESVLKIPYVGCDPSHMALSMDKDLTRAVVSAAGVSVPAGIVITKSDDPRLDSLPLPLIIKPACEDNSIGLTLANTEEEMREGVKLALEVDRKVVVEQFIPPGQEIRVGLIEKPDGTLQTLPKFEYHISENDPIRTSAHKLTKLDDNKEVDLAHGKRSCPADLPNDVVAELDRQAALAHQALNCRDYSLFDFRVDPDGQVYFLEACSYCSFAPRSVLVTMTNETHLKNPVFFDLMVDAAMSRGDGVAPSH
jgi:D-alanine-D-alanine ligase|mmetsp:Transcript_2026/g.2928  ORF Transcript_2026/g.2928 Transcript_2026/m.2928 type:complete len:357 (-) Transcript_2026:534-1604(-)|eukprot:CAMPEP_0113935296 /NCGR_PEP_ID=MMETSP1339-20121228/2452_1 /TAXON_ID=94617 /ORGANISM="Fibrocapsa japonica" /LENGTH=356 /DNA_ID=CAMNT_0000937391 /DNA_START=227 /DNA_END=1297 /DNA_ORIENTATION=- /assembly_acc=CAM_ASM_000762